MGVGAIVHEITAPQLRLLQTLCTKMFSTPSDYVHVQQTSQGSETLDKTFQPRMNVGLLCLLQGNQCSIHWGRYDVGT